MKPNLTVYGSERIAIPVKRMLRYPNVRHFIRHIDSSVTKENQRRKREEIERN